MNKISYLKNINVFNINIRKLMINDHLDDESVRLLLSISLILLEEYKIEKNKQYSIFAYYIVLKIANKYQIYEPLYDLSVNLGFYPISRFIIEKGLLDKVSIKTILVDCEIEDYKDNSIIETFHQKKVRQDIVNSEENEKSFIAPTSYGKSTLIYQYLKAKKFKKIAIIVPTKSLLVQTSKDVIRNKLNYKLILHEDMYENNEEFIGVLTQERALKLLNKHKDISFDSMIIDEAHNLLDQDPRSILLSRLIRRNKIRNPSTDILYLSPLVNSSNNLRFSEEQYIEENKIITSMKEPEIHYLKKTGDLKIYNRFFNEFYELDVNIDYKEYIFENLKNKNFFYLFKPKNVEIFSKELFNLLEGDESGFLNNLSKVLSDNVHEDFYCVDYIKKGILYLHGKIPDIIKEFLEFKFKNHSEIKFLISNNVILEGVNLPIDNIFILDNRMLDGKKLINLIGRANRLNDVFNPVTGSLEKLEPSIHFVEIESLIRKKCNMERIIQKLKSHIVTDDVTNPTLLNFEAPKFSTGNNKSFIDKNEWANQLKQDEDFIVNNENDESSLLLRVLIESGIKNSYNYLDFDKCFLLMQMRYNALKNGDILLDGSMFEKIYKFFIEGMESYINGDDLKRLSNINVRNYYSVFINKIHSLSVKQYLNDSIGYFRSRAKKERLLYVTTAYGEISKNDLNYKNYIDINTKSNKELINLLLIKMKIEMDFLSYKINNFVFVLRELDLINEKELNLFIYGTSERKNLDLIRLGLTPSLINYLDQSEQLSNINIESYGDIRVNKDFRKFFESLDDLKKFEIEKYIEI